MKSVINSQRHFLDRSRITQYPRRHPKTSDWGTRMTVCIASFEKSTSTIVAACDLLLSYGDIASDNAAEKFRALGQKWMCMFAAQDITPITGIYERMDKRLGSADIG